MPSTYGFCQSAYAGAIVEGNFNDTPLAGLNWAGLYMFPGEIAEGGGTRLIVIDERADDAQRIALETIISGEACAPLGNVFAVFGSLRSRGAMSSAAPMILLFAALNRKQKERGNPFVPTALFASAAAGS